MRVAALYDIHGNLPALDAVLADVARADVDTVVIGGDVVAGPLPRETLERILGLDEPARFVRGNADREVSDAVGEAEPGARGDDLSRQLAAFAASRLTGGQLELLDEFRDAVRLEIDGLGQVLFCHGSPRSDTEALTTETSEQRLRSVLADVAHGVVVCGHTHRQFDRRVAKWRIVNAGSVGMPYEGRAGAYWTLLGPGVELRRSEYDLEDAIGQLRGGGFPRVDEMLLESLLEPMDPDEVAAIFERQALEAEARSSSAEL